MPDKYKATWISYSSLSTYKDCPRAYYLQNVYRSPVTGNKIGIVKPALSLGKAVHNTLESLSELPKDRRLEEPLLDRFERCWEQVEGRKGGFQNEQEEEQYKQKGKEMLRKVEKNPGPLTNLAIKIDQDLPWFWISKKEEIILCGKVDWLEYIKETDSVHIIDFKTGKHRESDNSLQLPIYHLLVDHCQTKEVTKMSYWYLREGDMEQRSLPPLDQARKKVLSEALEIKRARQAQDFDCPAGEDGCFHCRPFEKIISGDAKLVGRGEYGKDLYIIE